MVVSTAFCSEGNNAMVATDYFGLLQVAFRFKILGILDAIKGDLSIAIIFVDFLLSKNDLISVALNTCPTRNNIFKCRHVQHADASRSRLSGQCTVQ